MQREALLCILWIVPYKDPEKQREWQQRWRERNRAMLSAKSRAWYADNRDRALARMADYRVDNLALYAGHAAKRRALKANAAQGDASESSAYADILREGICELCGSRGPIEIDHIEALSTGGEHTWENFAGLCRSCNASKHTESLLSHMRG